MNINIGIPIAINWRVVNSALKNKKSKIANIVENTYYELNIKWQPLRLLLILVLIDCDIFEQSAIENNDRIL